MKNRKQTNKSHVEYRVTLLQIKLYSNNLPCTNTDKTIGGEGLVDQGLWWRGRCVGENISNPRELLLWCGIRVELPFVLY